VHLARAPAAIAALRQQRSAAQEAVRQAEAEAQVSQHG
jgi:hypothetical protein